ncbi:hypothetical protein [Terricaulis sp.]|uniref:hypothetical protein n=1 Tax=Terricaulis sp. TaxID=2768686 RepID=UPI003783E423
MKLPLALGVAFAALSMTAYAQPRQHDRVVVRHHPAFNIDANDDGWISRQEASNAADRIFDDIDTNHDGRLTSEDHAAHMAEFDVDVDVDVDVDTDAPEGTSVEEGERRVRVITREHDAHGRAQEGEERGENERVERTVTVVRVQGGGAWEERADGVAPAPPVPPVPPVPPHPPMFMMIFANSEESDLNGDGALSREEFRAQHLRFFDASDANNDGRVRYTPPPEPPTPPAPPAPPRPPRAPHH